MFDSLTFASDLDAALERAETRQAALAEKGKDAAHRFWALNYPNVPTAAELHEHARRYGPDSIGEIASLYGIDLKVKTVDPKQPKRGRRTTEELRRQVLALHERGLVLTAIADAVNVSDRRVKQLLAGAVA